MRTPRSTRTTAGLAVAGLLALSALTACSSSNDDDASTDSAGAGGSAGQPGIERAPSGSTRAGDNAASAASLADGKAYEDASEPQQGAKTAPLLQSEALIKTGSVSLQSDDIGHVLTQVYGIVGGVGGDISREDTTTDSKGKAVRSALVLRVPVEEFDSTLNDLSQLGTMVNRVRNAKDVTTEVADIDSRVRSAQRSITTLRQLFDRATKLTDIIRLESELSQREADLESLEAQQRSLNDRTTMSTITMTLELPPVPPKPTPKPEEDDKAGGFVSGIQQGWDALKATTVAIGHVIGVVLPLGTVALVLAGIAYWVVRRFAPHTPAPPHDTAEA